MQKNITFLKEPNQDIINLSNKSYNPLTTIKDTNNLMETKFEFTTDPIHDINADEITYQYVIHSDNKADEPVKTILHKFLSNLPNLITKGEVIAFIKKAFQESNKSVIDITFEGIANYLLDEELIANHFICHINYSNTI